MSLILDGTAGVTFPSGSGTQAAQSKVLQVVNATYGTSTSTSTNTYIDTGLTATITPLFSTSKILCIVDVAGCSKYGSNTSVGLRLVRNSTNILSFEGIAGASNGTGVVGAGASSCNYLDSPSTTSSTTYKVQLCSANNGAIVYINDNFTSSFPSTSTITLMEIAQ
jgi:hypothetical protein